MNYRLRSIRQLGSTHYVYPGGKHTRWEHSVGTSFLASQFLDAIEKKKPGSFTRKDYLCVTIGALCHDLGHGPFRFVEMNKMRHEKLIMYSLSFTATCLRSLSIWSALGVPGHTRWQVSRYSSEFMRSTRVCSRSTGWMSRT